jgi:hypothetical protein
MTKAAIMIQNLFRGWFERNKVEKNNYKKNRAAKKI